MPGIKGVALHSNTFPKPTILIVDDNEDILWVLKQLLKTERYKIIKARSGDAALGLMQKYPVDVILADSTMPGMSGIELLRRVKANWPDTIRIIMSGNFKTEDFPGIINELEVYRLIQKSGDMTEIKTHIKEAIKWKSMRFISKTR